MDAGIHDAAATNQLARSPPATGRIDVVGVVIDVQRDYLAERALVEQPPGLASGSSRSRSVTRPDQISQPRVNRTSVSGRYRSSSTVAPR